MSGFEIVGAVAVGFQFVEQLVTVGKLIFSVYNQLQDGPAQILQRLQELQTFSDIVKQVKSTESLQTDITKDIFHRCDKHTRQLIAIFKNISSATSSASLSHRTWKAIVGVAKEDDILKIFVTLEREKSALQLHIDALNTYVLQDPLDLTDCPDKNPTLTHISDPHFNRGWRLSTRKSAVSNSTPFPTTLTSLATASVAWLRRTRLQFARDSRQSEGKSSREHATGFSKMPITKRGYAPRLNFSGSRAAQGWAKPCCQSI